MNSDEIIFECPCGLKLSDALNEFVVRDVIKEHGPEHIERVLELKKLTSLPPIGMGGSSGGGVVVTNCSELHAVDISRDGTVSK